MLLPWRIHSDTWPQLSARKRLAYAVIVRSYGGVCDEEKGLGDFPCYRAVEVCAYTLEQRLDVRPRVGLSSAVRPTTRPRAAD